ncbi:hypothetical protein [Arthrobacter sp. M4]|uniref:hypothetical protein n=1 Tax=Arthrobacter sp. M4 TaxID=218160 RepID=UPI001CDC657F|nr:hypothetical protein [Arthrobacter sp. M4]MCA4135537.1 hypothetical protein [Arthrobacter sp. M4]
MPVQEHGEPRHDLQNLNVREDVALTGRCGNVHLATGRICTLPARHPGPCQFVSPDEANRILS